MRHSIACLLATVAALLLGLVATRYVYVLSYLSPFYSAQTHVCLLAAGIATASLVARRSRPAAAVLVAALVMAAHIPVRLYALSDIAGAQETAGRPAIRVLSFNILSDNLENGPSIRDEVLASGADIAVILEAAPLENELAALSTVYPYRLGCLVQTPNCDLMILSKTPFAQTDVGTLSELRAERYLQVVTEVGGRKINVAAAHLSKPYFDSFHAEELWHMVERLGALEGPLVLAGDFNAASANPDMMWFLRRTGLRRVPLEPSTWPVEFGSLGIAIDHVFARAPMRLTAVKRIENAHGSNHSGLIADLILD